MNSKDKGTGYECKIMGEMRPLFPDIMTSRNGSKATDDKGVDFLNTDPYAIQAKAWERAPSMPELLRGIEKNFPTLIPIVVRKKNYKPETVTMLKKDFYSMVEKIKRFEKMFGSKKVDELLKSIDKHI